MKNTHEQNRVILENKDAEIARLYEEIDDFKSRSGQTGLSNAERSLKNIIFFDEGITAVNDTQQRNSILSFLSSRNKSYGEWIHCRKK